MAAATESALSLELDRTQIAIVCGSGGVGKTSIAAAMALGEAMRGRSVCVLTIDPARRLADAMGLSALEDQAKRVKLPAGATKGGQLWALMLDPKQAFDRLVREAAPDEARVERIFANRVYRQISTHAAGMQEYMALERLYELDRTGKYDLIVVDTPPTAHARDLLESPARMLRFIVGRSLRWFLKPTAKMGRLGLRVIGGPGGMIVGIVQRITGVEMLRDVTDFFEAFEGMYEQIADRVRVVERMFSDPASGFFVVTSPERESVEEAISFWDLLNERNLRYAGGIVNRIEPEPPQQAATKSQLTEVLKDPKLAALVFAAQKDRSAIAARDHERVERLVAATDRALTLQVPRRPRLVSDLTGLLELRPYLYE